MADNNRHYDIPDVRRSPTFMEWTRPKPEPLRVHVEGSRLDVVEELLAAAQRFAEQGQADAAREHLVVARAFLKEHRRG